MGTLLPNNSTYTNTTVGQYFLGIGIENLGEELKYPDDIAKLLENPNSNLKKIIFSHIIYIINKNHLYLLLQQQTSDLQKLRDLIIDLDTEAKQLPLDLASSRINQETLERLKRLEAELRRLQLELEDTLIKLDQVEEKQLKVLLLHGTRFDDMFTDQKQKLLKQIDQWAQKNPGTDKLILLEDVKEQLSKQPKTLAEIIEKISASHGAKVKDNMKFLILNQKVIQEIRFAVALRTLIKENILSKEDAKLLVATIKNELENQTKEQKAIEEEFKDIKKYLTKINERIQNYVSILQDENQNLRPKTVTSPASTYSQDEDLEMKDSKKPQTLAAVAEQIQNMMESVMDFLHLAKNNVTDKFEQSKQISTEFPPTPGPEHK
jgi:hypothetical protein